VAHNVIGWSATLVIVGRAGGVTRTAYKTCWVWAATTLAIWVVVWTAAWAEAVADWAFWTLIQLVVGLALVSTGLIEGGKLPVGAGLLFVGLVPVILAFPTSATVASGILMGTVYGAFGILGWLGWRRERRAG
jgi:hypothetical protein